MEVAPPPHRRGRENLLYTAQPTKTERGKYGHQPDDHGEHYCTLPGTQPKPR